MAYLVACLSSGKGTWAQVYRLIEKERWEKVILITNEFGREKFERKPGTTLVTIDSSVTAARMKDLLVAALKPLMKDLSGFSDVAVNISSGSGKEHMAVLSSLMAIGVGFRLIDLQDDRIIEL